MESEKRSKRVSFRNLVHFGPTNPPEITSFVTDISATGLCIKTNRFFRPGTKLFMVIETASKDFKAEGIVVWAKRVPPHLVRIVKSGMGVKFTQVDQTLLELYKEKS